MSDDPLSQALESGDDPYGTPPAQSVLKTLFKGAHPELLAEATAIFLERLTLLEMYLEQEMNLEIGQKELERFRNSRADDIALETARMAQLFYGKIATREGG
ncbi:MAG: hypothetical protein V2A56_06240 [bacterium]